LLTIAVVAAFYLGISEAAVVIVLYVLGERLEDIGLENSKSALDRIGKHSQKMAFVKRKTKCASKQNPCWDNNPGKTGPNDST
jgi:Cd2+/Zn2+-exporting ATPase